MLHYFHKASNERRIIPILVTRESAVPDLLALNQQEFFPQLSSYWIAPVLRSSCRISQLFCWRSAATPAPKSSRAIGVLVPSSGPKYHRRCDRVAERPLHPRDRTLGGVRTRDPGCLHRPPSYVNRARAENRHAICFLTGVPGSGKTLVGLSLAHSAENRASAIHFMSGNGPLVKVLQHLFTQESRRGGASTPQAKTEAKTLIENVHVFARTNTEDNPCVPIQPRHHLRRGAARMESRAEHEEVQVRRPHILEMLLKIMERHSDWSVVVALVGGGQGDQRR